MKEIILCFDVDGTLDCSQGPVPVRLLDELYGRGYPVVIVSPSSNYREATLPRMSDHPSRAENLKHARSLYAPEALVRLYVSDNRDQSDAHQAHFTLIEPQEFLEGCI